MTSLLPNGLDRRLLLGALAAVPVVPGFFGATEAQAQPPTAAPLASWNDGPAKQSILDFVRVTTDRASPNFVAPDDRIAAFDQDGTLWVEHPLYTQVVFCFERIGELARANPAMREREPFKTIVSGNREAIARLSERDLIEIVLTVQSGMSVEAFDAEVKAWLAKAKDPRWGRPLYAAGLPADAGGAAAPARQWRQDVHRNRRQRRLRPCQFTAGITASRRSRSAVRRSR